MNQKKIVTTEILEGVVRSTSADKISIKDLMFAMHSGGFGLIMTIFSLPIIIPLPPPLPSLICIPMAVFAFQMMIGMTSPKLPKFLLNKTIKKSILALMVEKSAPHIRKAESIVKPRMLALSTPIFRRIIGFFCFIFSASVLLPVPLSNFIPGMGVLIASFGLLSRDGMFIILGLTIGCFGVFVTTAAILLGVEAIHMAKEIILNWIF